MRDTQDFRGDHVGHGQKKVGNHWFKVSSGCRLAGQTPIACSSSLSVAVFCERCSNKALQAFARLCARVPARAAEAELSKQRRAKTATIVSWECGGRLVCKNCSAAGLFFSWRSEMIEPRAPLRRLVDDRQQARDHISLPGHAIVSKGV